MIDEGAALAASAAATLRMMEIISEESAKMQRLPAIHDWPDKTAWLETVMAAASGYVPALRDVRVTGVREGVRMVLADVEDTDARPSMVNLVGPGYVEVFSGKIVHAMWAGAEVERLLDGGHPSAPASRA